MPPQIAAAIHNTNVEGYTPLPTPGELAEAMPIPSAIKTKIAEDRRAIENVLRGKDPRMLVIVGPCSIHDPEAAMDYAKRLASLRDEVSDRLLLVMRVYFEKPRTTLGWKGLINDPHLDGSFDMPLGLRRARQLLLDVASLGLPAGTELLEPITPQYLSDLIAWAAIGARTTESQTHRQMASGLSMPVGFKNSTDGNLDVALDAMQAAMAPHHFLGINEDGRSCVVATRGNAFGHIILRGGRARTNYAPADIDDASGQLTERGLSPVVMVDCSHANSGKKHEQQAVVWTSLIEQIREVRAKGLPSPIIGAMLESNLHPGNQKLTAPDDMAYGVSITDACLGWDETEPLLREAYRLLG